MKYKYYLILFLLSIISACNNDSDNALFHPDFKVYVLFPEGGIGDRSFSDIIYEGVEESKNDFDFEVNYVIPNSFQEGEEWIQNIDKLSNENDEAAMVIIAGSQYADAINSIKGEFGKQKILLLGGTAADQENLSSITYRTFAASYIGGYLSAKQKQNCRAISIAGFDAPFLTEYQRGFEQGVMDAGGSISPTEFISTGFDGFEMPDLAYEKTTAALVSNDLVFAMSAGSNLGIINAARNYNEQRYIIGIDADQSWMGKKVVTGSVIKLFGTDIYEYIANFSSGNFNNGIFVKTMEEARINFLINSNVLGDIKIPEDLIKTAIEKENKYSN